jgi:membrane protein
MGGDKAMGAGSENWAKLKRFLGGGIWEIDPRALGRGQLFLLQQGQLAALVARDFVADHCLLRASALTYTTLLSIVPLLALMFSLLKGLGVQDLLEPLILDRIAVGSEKIVSQIIEYINNTNFGQLGTLGLVALIFSVLALLSNIEESFNHVWGVTETRSLLRRFADYFSVVIFGPILLLAAVSMTATLQTERVLQWLVDRALFGQVVLFLFSVLPYLAMWAAFTFLYIFMPNTKVSFRSALIGGVIGGTIWQLTQWGYVHFQVGVARYNAIYGTMAALPIFMVWLYLSWLIVLFGLEIAYANQNLKTIRQEIRGGIVNFASREMVALTVLLVVAEAFHRGESPWSRERIGEELELPPRLAGSVLNDLVRLGLLAVVQHGTEDAYQPGRSPDTLEVAQVIRILREDGISYTRLRERPERQVILEVEERLASAQGKEIAGLTLKDLVMQILERRDGAGREERSGQ